MTGQEAEMLAVWLEKVWDVPLQWQWVESSEEIVISGQIAAEVRFFYQWHETSYQCELWRTQNKELTGRVFCTLDTGIVGSSHPHFYTYGSWALKCAQFADEWMDFFRRCCWLSGCPIEASAHEKAE